VKGNSSLFWNKIKETRKNNNIHSTVTMVELVDLYKNKFAKPVDKTSGIKLAEAEVDALYHATAPGVIDNKQFIFTEQMVKRYISKLKVGRACGMDGISAEHLVYGHDSKLPLVLSSLFTACFRWGLVPDEFTKGLLLPIPKANKDYNKAENLRPITISSVTSKIVEMYINEQLLDFEYGDKQFGFVEKRGTTMAVSLVHDVACFMNNNGSPIYVCALDAQGAFDFIPHSILLKKAYGTLTGITWHLLAYWYHNMHVHIRWRNQMSRSIDVARGCRQGGLTSPSLFNCFYKELIEELDVMKCGITINGSRYNVFNYADDILLASTTITGLQMLIDRANSSIQDNGLVFNPRKTECCVLSDKNIDSNPAWYMDERQLQVCDTIKYLGVTLGRNCGAAHSQERIRSMNKAFASLQGAGLCDNGLSPLTATSVFKAAVEPVLLYGCESVFMSAKTMFNADKAYAKLIKCMLGLSKFSRTTPLLRALNLKSPSYVIGLSSIKLLQRCIFSSSSTQAFYLYLMRVNNNSIKGTLPHRVGQFCHETDNGIDLSQIRTLHINCNFTVNQSYKNDGVAESAKFLLSNYHSENKHLLQLLLNAF